MIVIFLLLTIMAAWVANKFFERKPKPKQLPPAPKKKSHLRVVK